MASWEEFEADAPELAVVATRLWPGVIALHRGDTTQSRSPWFSIAYLATTRPDGSPRLHPFCPVLADGTLYAVISRSSPKGDDLRRDARCVIHALPGPDDDEFSIRARAREVGDDLEVRRRVVDLVGASGVGGMIETASARSIVRVRHPPGRCRTMARHREARNPSHPSALDAVATHRPVRDAMRSHRA